MQQYHPDQLHLLTKWRSQLATIAARKPWLAGVLLRRSRRLLRRFSYFYHHLQTLSRRRRRLLRRKLGTPLAGAALLLALSGVPAQANSITVAAGVVNRDSSDGKCSLIEAIDNANDTNLGHLHPDCAAGNPIGADTINLPAGSLFTLTAIDNNTTGPTGLPVISSEVVIEGNGAVIQRDSSLEFRILVINHSGRLTLNETTIRGGLASGGGLGNSGGGILSQEGFLTINNSAISDNEAEANGGGIFNAENVTILNNSLLSGNLASNNGGGIYNIRSTLAITNSVISNNQAEFNGGGVFNEEGALKVANSAISGNSAHDGGGVYNIEDEAAITNSAISNNQVADEGGGVFNSTSALVITNSTISGNQAERGGGLLNTGESDLTGTLTITHSTISDNQAAGEGGGVYNYQYGLTNLAYSIISGNSASTGAEVFNKETVDYYYNPVEGVINANNRNLLGHAGLSNATAFEFFTPGANDINAASDGENFSLDNILETTLADNGGDTQTHALVADSPALDAVSNAVCATTPLNVDQRGQPRNADGDFQGDSGAECDIGAFERQESFLTLVKKLDGDNSRQQDFRFETPFGPITLTTNTDADTKSRDLPPDVYPIQETLSSGFSLLSVTCVDDEDRDVTAEVVNNFFAAEQKADITLAKSDDLTCTFLNENTEIENTEIFLSLPMILKLNTLDEGPK